jgi:hypothetical protein
MYTYSPVAQTPIEGDGETCMKDCGSRNFSLRMTARVRTSVAEPEP